MRHCGNWNGKPVIRGHLYTVKHVIRGHLYAVKPVIKGHLTMAVYSIFFWGVRFGSTCLRIKGLKLIKSGLCCRNEQFERLYPVHAVVNMM
jgi:hypothetical protein